MMFPPILHDQHQVTSVPPPALNTNFSHSSLPTSPNSRSNSRTMDLSAIAEIPRRDSNQEKSSPARGSISSPTTVTNVNTPVAKNPCYVENGREYHGYHKGIYLYPCDEAEQDRLDVFHKLFEVARFQKLHYACIPERAKPLEKQKPLVEPGEQVRVLDLGCGTGIWAIEMAKIYPNAYFLGIDLAAIQPQNRPINCDFHAPCDFEGLWALGEDSWDLINLRMGCGSVSSWPDLYRRVIAHLRPGGSFEQIEIDFEPRCEPGDPPPQLMKRWYSELKEATETVRRPIAYQKNTPDMLKAAGFVEIVHQIVGLPMNRWPEVEHENKVGRWYNLALSESLETLSLAPFSRCKGMSVEDIRKYAAEVKSEVFNKQIRSFNLIHIFTARKPYPHERSGA